MRRPAMMGWLVLALAACAAADEVDEGSGSTFSGGVEGSDGTSTETGADMKCPGGCEDPPGACFEPLGACVEGSCAYVPAQAGTPCDGAGFCDAMGNCLGGDGDGDGDGDCETDADCERPNAAGATCEEGGCTGWQCDDGWDDCNATMSDGCEASLASPEHCGACDAACQVGDNAFATCEAGECGYGCQDPWENCDGDWNNGCEIPTGVPFQCDFTGLNMNTGCGTAYCGQSNAAKTQNFAGWYCIACPSCRAPGNGQCQWCDHNTTATFFPAEACSCGGYEDLACSPG